MNSDSIDQKVSVAVVTGHHPFDVVAFHALWKSFAQFEVYVQHMEDFVTDIAKVRQSYDVVVFYNFHQQTPGNETEWWDKSTLTALEQLGATSQGIMILHHALLAYKQWPMWDELVGVKERSMGFHPDQTLQVHIENAGHPITNGLKDFEITDETYTMTDALASAGNTILLTTNHEKSMKTLAWTRKYRNSDVFCWESGHDGAAFANPAYLTIMEQAILWLAKR